MSTIYELSEDDKKKLINARSHMGSNNVNEGMTEYILYQRRNGNFVINLDKTWEKILLAAYKIVEVQKKVKNNDIVVSCERLGNNTVLNSANHMELFLNKNYSTAGIVLNPDHCNHVGILVATNPTYHSSLIKKLSIRKTTIIAFCNTDSPTDYVDVVIPCNNKSNSSVNLIWSLLTREVLRLKGKNVENVEWNICAEETQAELGESSNTVECDYDETASRYCSDNLSDNYWHVPAACRSNSITNRFYRAETSGNNSITNRLYRAETSSNNWSSNDLSEVQSNVGAILQLGEDIYLHRSSTISSSNIGTNLNSIPDIRQMNSVTRVTANPNYNHELNLNNPITPGCSNYAQINSIVRPNSHDIVNVYSQRYNPQQFLGNTQPDNLSQFPNLPQYSNAIQSFNSAQLSVPARYLGIPLQYNPIQFPSSSRLPNVTLYSNSIPFSGRPQFSSPQQVINSSQILRTAQISNDAITSHYVKIFQTITYKFRILHNRFQ